MIEQAIRTARTLMPQTSSVTLKQIEEIANMILLLPTYDSVNKEELIRQLKTLYNIRVDNFRIIEASERRRKWINDAKGGIEWKFWNRYREFLQFEKNYPDNVLAQLDKLTDRVLDGLFNPRMEEGISKYGLVVGQVQSGKTSNYTGLICKAADAGFKLIIVLAGVHNNLRSQTQLRLDEGFLGFDTQHQRAFDNDGIKIGVGKISQKGVAHSLTSSLDKGDFSATAVGFSFNTTDPIIAVVKKNSTVLSKLYSWLSAQAIELPDGSRIIDNKSLLLIDDEADNASINTKPDEDPATAINQRIREILSLFHKSGYVGYTATPFANIFIPITEDQLFPRDFIINLPAPSNYIGPEKIFGIRPPDEDETPDNTLPIVVRINDYQELIPNGHKKNSPLPDEIPDSLNLAIRCFILTCAVRRLRGQVNVHNSMLIHTSRFINWQNHITGLIEGVFDTYRRGIEFNSQNVLSEFRNSFENDRQYEYLHNDNIYKETYKSYKTVSGEILINNPEIDSRVKVHTWDEVYPFLHDAASRISVREINGGSGDALNYFDHKDGLSVIAVGGDKLSRGLTLEGLSVSYYLRASRMYDTLMQMGRWFGYRPGYVDLCRLFTSRELNEWFCHITLASEELRGEFDYMADVAGSTPEQFALKVRTHPGVLQISASNKIRRAATVQVSWAGKLVESYQLNKARTVIDKNIEVTKEFIKSLGAEFQANSNNYLWNRISVEKLHPFMSRFKVAESLKRVDPSYLLQYIGKQNNYNELTMWNIGVMSKHNTKNRFKIEITGKTIDIGLWERTNDDKKEDATTYYIRKNHIISPKDEFIDLSEEEYSRALERTNEFYKRNNNGEEYKYDYPKGEIVRNEFRKSNTALLLIYFLDPRGAGIIEHDNPIVGFAISFPGSRNNAVVEYAVHNQLLSLFDIDDEIENDNNEED